MATGSGDEITVKVSTDNKQGIAGIQEYTAALDRTTANMRTVAQMTQVLGASAAQSGQAWLNAAGSAQQYTDRLNYLKAQLGLTTEQQRQAKLQQDQYNEAQRQAKPQYDQAAQSLNQVTAAMRTVSQMAQQMGPAQAQAGQAWLAAARNADDYRNRLDYLRAQLNYFNETQRQTGEGAQGLQFNMQSLGQQIFSSMGSFGAFALTANSVLGVIGEIGGAVTGLIDTFVSFGETIATVVVGALEQAGQAIEGLIQQVFQLNEQTEKNFFNWAYLYGGPKGGGVAAAGELARWTKDFSLQIPFTRQDLMSAVTTLSAEDNANPQQIEHQLALISDVAATQGRPGLTLQWAAMAALRASQPGGSARMLMMDLNLNKTELANYGYDESDPTSFWPALEAYERHKGSYGASRSISTQTLWGAQTSAIDRLQNFGLGVGGWNDNPKTLTDDVKKGSMFWYLKQDLVDLTNWWDNHKPQLDQIMNLFGNILGGGMKNLTAGFQGLADGIHKSGLDKLLTDILGGFGKWLNDPSTTANMKKFGDAFGQLGGTAISTTLQALGAFFQGLSSTGVPQALFNGLINMFNNIGAFFTAHKQEINEFFYELGKVSGKALQDVGQGFKDIGAAFQNMKANMSTQDWANLKWFISDNTIGVIGRIGLAFKGLADVLAGILVSLTGIMQAMDWINQHTGGAGGGYGGNVGGGGDSGGGGGGGGGGNLRKSYMPGAYTANNNTQLHFYGATMPVVTSAVQRILDVADRASYLAKRTPGGFASLGILG